MPWKLFPHLYLYYFTFKNIILFFDNLQSLILAYTFKPLSQSRINHKTNIFKEADTHYQLIFKKEFKVDSQAIRVNSVSINQESM